MCLILLVWRMHPQYPCLVAANRDEFHARPTAAAAWWPDRPQILAGKDLEAGGTWLGVTRSGRFAALTNYRDPQRHRAQAAGAVQAAGAKPGAAPGGATPSRGTPSRGTLVTSLLDSTARVPEGLAYLHELGAQFNPFNVIFSDGERLGIYESAVGAGRELGPGIYGLSNHILDTPWPKVENAKTRLAAALEDLTDTAPLLELLRDDLPAADDELPRTGVNLQWERLLSSAFVRSPDYGTRCSTIIRIARTGRAYFDEWSWDSEGADSGRVSLRFELE